MTDTELQIFEDKDSFWILTDKAEFWDGAWVGDGYVDDKFAIVPKSIPDAKNRAELIVNSVNNLQQYREALRRIERQSRILSESNSPFTINEIAKNALKLGKQK